MAPVPSGGGLSFGSWEYPRPSWWVQVHSRMSGVLMLTVWKRRRAVPGYGPSSRA